jgi:hypothetical protein
MQKGHNNAIVPPEQVISPHKFVRRHSLTFAKNKPAQGPPITVPPPTQKNGLQVVAGFSAGGTVATLNWNLLENASHEKLTVPPVIPHPLNVPFQLVPVQVKITVPRELNAPLKVA